MQRDKFWKDSIEDIVHEDFAEEVREYALLNGCALGEATWQICERMRMEPELNSTVNQSYILADAIGVEREELARRAIRVLHSAAQERLDRLSEQIRKKECDETQEEIEKCEFESSLTSDPREAARLLRVARGWRKWIREQWGI